MIRHRSKNKIMVYIWFTLFGFLQIKCLIIKYLIKFWVYMESIFFDKKLPIYNQGCLNLLGYIVP